MTKSQINKLGKELRKQIRDEVNPSNALLDSLQLYRTTFKDDLSSVFEIITKTAKEGRSDSIVSFRIKRIESILSKIKRQPTMALGNMGDIAGCRVLVYSEDALSKLILKFNSIFNIKYFNDYTVESKDDGYRGYHFYIESPINPNKLIEIQLRTVTSHKWASMVEIVDILYDLKIKEGQKHPDFEKFLLLFSNKNNLSNSEKKELLKIDDKFKVYNKLNEVFVKNHIQIRMDWLKISNQNNNYFIIEVDAEKTSKIYSFNTYEKAEENYFNKFKENNNSNFVLTHIEKPNFKRLCIAYASYVLIKHDYLNDWNEFTSDILKESIDKNNKIDLHFFKNYTKRNLDDQMALIKSELDEAKKYKETSEIDTKGFEEWVNEIKENLEKVTNLAMKRANANGKSKKGFIQKLLGI